jgi:Ca-activated chloride channel family protein
LSAAEIAKSFGIRIYTVGVGSKGMAPMPVQTPYGEQIMQVEVNIDEQVLQDVAKSTDGMYFRATDNKSLEEIYSEIDQLEKSKIEVNIFQNKTEEYTVFGLMALLIILIETALRLTILRIKP